MCGIAFVDAAAAAAAAVAAAAAHTSTPAGSGTAPNLPQIGIDLCENGRFKCVFVILDRGLNWEV